jgi:hypothetical protein
MYHRFCYTIKEVNFFNHFHAVGQLFAINSLIDQFVINGSYLYLEDNAFISDLNIVVSDE